MVLFSKGDQEALNLTLESYVAEYNWQSKGTRNGNM
jgi:hypothetical protein